MVNVTDFAPFIMQMQLMGFSFDVTELVMRLLSLAVLVVVTQMAISASKPLFKLFDDKIDLIWKVDFPARIHKAIGKSISLIITIVAVYFAFFLWGTPDIWNNVIFQLAEFFLACKLGLVAVAPIVRGLDEMITHKAMSTHARKLFEKAVKYVIYVLFIIGAIYILGFTDIFTAAIAGAGVMGIALGFAAKDTVANVFGGVAVILDRPFRIGDTIEVLNYIGVVDEIALRSTQVKQFDNKVVIIPNSLLANSPVVNYTKEKMRRFDVPVGIAYDSDIEHAVNVIKEAVSGVDGVLTGDKAPIVIVDKFAESSVDLKVRFWIDTAKGVVKTKSKVTAEIKAALDKAGIEIPFPVRVMIEKKK